MDIKNGNYNKFEVSNYGSVTFEVGEKQGRDKGAKMEKKIKTNLIELIKGLDIDKRIIELLGDYIVDSNSIRLTPSGLSIGGKVYSKRADELLDVRGTELLSDIPTGFSVPTEISDIEIGDIIFDDNKTPMYVLKIIDRKKLQELTCISPKENRRINLLPTTDLLGNKVYNKLITPFNYDFGCNPLLNVSTVFAVGYINDDLDTVLDKLLPQAMKLISKMDLGKLMKDKRIVYLAPLLTILYKISKANGFKADLSLNNIKNSISKIDNRTKTIILLTLGILLYISKDKIAEQLMSDKIEKIPFIGKYSQFISKMLIKIPSIEKNFIKNIEKKIVNLIKTDDSES